MIVAITHKVQKAYGSQSRKEHHLMDVHTAHMVITTGRAGILTKSEKMAVRDVNWPYCKNDA